MGRAPCCAKVGLHRGPWTTTEDSLLVNYIQAHGEGQWRNLPKKAGLLRCGKSCRLRWMNYLRPDIKRGNITPEEEDLIIRLHGLLGNRWSLIAGRIPGRTDNEIKNYWNTTIIKKLRRAQHNNPGPPKPSKPSKKKKNINNNNNKTSNIYAAVVEKSKVHTPKPVRITSRSLSLTRNNSNASFTSNASGAAPAYWPLDQSSYDGMTMTMDAREDRGGLTFLIGCEDDDMAGVGVREQGIMEGPPASDQNMLDKLYEEYLQLIEADEANWNQERGWDSFAESLLI